MTDRRGFTLIEILVAVMLTGLLTGLALAPVVVTVRQVVDARQEYTDIAALTLTLDFIARDMFSAMRMSPNTLSVKDHNSIGGKPQDILTVMSSAPSLQGMSAGAVVYKIDGGGLLHGNILPGLYRWILPSVDPSEIDFDKLSPEDAQLVLPGADEFRVEVPTNEREDDNQKEYTGSLPAGVFMRIGRGESNYAQSVIALP